MTLEEFAERCRNLPDGTQLSIICGINGPAVMLTDSLRITGCIEPGEPITEAVERLLTLAEEKA